MQTMMVQDGQGFRAATSAEVCEAASIFVRKELNRAKPRIDSAEQVVEYLKRIYGGRDHETFGVLFLDARHRLIEFAELFRGTIDGSSVHPREVVKECLWRSAAKVLFVHNHPSGSADSSNADLIITRRLREALALIDVEVLDHVIIGGTGQWSSMANLGLL